MSYIKVEHPLYKIYFLASDVKEEKQKWECNMLAFKIIKHRKHELKASASSTALAP